MFVYVQIQQDAGYTLYDMLQVIILMKFLCNLSNWILLKVKKYTGAKEVRNHHGSGYSTIRQGPMESNPLLLLHLNFPRRVPIHHWVNGDFQLMV